MAFNQWYKGVKDYLWPSTEGQTDSAEQQEHERMSRLARIRRLSQILENSSYSNTQQQQICMFYGSLIDEYPQARSSKRHPQFLYEPEVYVPLVNFTIPIKVQTPQLYCELQLVIVFQQGLAANPPSFFIRNPDFTKYKPRDKFVRFGKEVKETHKFEAIYGGVRVLVPTVWAQRWEWTAQGYYIQENIVNMVKWVNKVLLLDYFPFAKRKIPISTDIVHKSHQMRNFLDSKAILTQRENDLQEIPLLENIQSATTLTRSIEAETDILREEIAAMKDIIIKSQHFNITEFLPQPRDKKSEIILDALSSLEACKDVENEVQKQFLRGNLDLAALKFGIEDISGKKFDDYYRLAYWKSPELLW